LSDSYFLEPLSAILDLTNIIDSDAVIPGCIFSQSRILVKDIGLLRKTIPSLRNAKADDDFSEIVERPRESPKENPRAWWRYAIATVLLPRPRVGWRSLVLGLRKRKDYMNHFLAFLEADTQEERQNHHSALVSLERTLGVEETVSFRLWVYNELRDYKVKVIPSTRPARSKVGEGQVEAEILPTLLSAESRLKSFLEIAEALQRKSSSVPSESDRDGQKIRQLLFKASLQCSEFSLQVSDSQVSYDGTILSMPIIRLSCAVDHRQDFFTDNSWNVVSRICSLIVRDCTGSTKWFREEAACLMGLL